MNKTALFAVVALVVAAGAAASTITVTQRTDTLNIFAERFDLRQQLTVAAGTILPAPADRTAAGTSGLPVEIASGLPEARTAILRDHWTYTVEVREADVHAFPSGIVSVALLVDNVPVGTVFVEQRAAEAAAVEGARVTFDLGTTLRPDALYYVEIKPYVPAGPTLSFTLRSVAGPQWEGVGGAIEGAVNPALSATVGATVRLTARNADGGFHDIGVKDAAGNLVTPPGWSDDIDAVGEEVTIAWTASAAGTYTYLCKYHPSSMAGTLTVTS